MSCSVCAGYSSYNCPCCGEDVGMMTCPDCEGSGQAPHMAWHIHLRIPVKVTQLTWLMIPKDEDEAIAKGENWCRMERDVCPTCKGEGEIPEDH